MKSKSESREDDLVKRMGERAGDAQKLSRAAEKLYSVEAKSSDFL